MPVRREQIVVPVSEFAATPAASPSLECSGRVRRREPASGLPPRRRLAAQLAGAAPAASLPAVPTEAEQPKPQNSVAPLLAALEAAPLAHHAATASVSTQASVSSILIFSFALGA